MSKAEMCRYNVTTNVSAYSDTIEAAYFVHDDRFTVFKAADGGVLASYANDHIVSVTRLADPRHAPDCIDGSKCGEPSNCPGR